MESYAMKYAFTVAFVAGFLLLAGCETRSISDSGYRQPYGWGRSENPLYKGELTELDILGAAPREEATEANIARSLAAATTPRLKRGDKLILIQSGAPAPDNAMLEEANRYFEVAPFSGIPPVEKSGLSESLRLRAAQGAYHFIVCYWGFLESAREDKEGRIVSWVPIFGNFVPDQKQQMRIRLKGILLDVGSGGWKMLTPEAYSDARYNSNWSREVSDQRLVLALKEKGYRSFIADLLK
jgi:hypothetical protein